MDPIEFHKLAWELSRKQDSASIRTGMSRTYYALFHLAADHLRSLGFTIVRNSQGHKQVSDRLSQAGVGRVAEIGTFLDDLRGLRINADYKLDLAKHERPKTLEHMLHNVDEMVTDLDHHVKNDADTIRTSINQYL